MDNNKNFYFILFYFIGQEINKVMVTCWCLV